MVTITQSCFADVHAMVLGQHAVLRSRLCGLEASVGLAASSLADSYLRLLLVRFAALFDAHLAFEDQELAPRIRELDCWGPIRERRMLDEHVEQRKQLENMTALAESESPAHAVAAAAARLVAELLEDMSREEDELAKLADIEAFGYDQMTG